MNHFPSREQVQALRERYPPGTMIQLTADIQIRKRCWQERTVGYILSNEKYIGDTLVQKQYHGQPCGDCAAGDLQSGAGGIRKAEQPDLILHQSHQEQQRQVFQQICPDRSDAMRGMRYGLPPGNMARIRKGRRKTDRLAVHLQAGTGKGSMQRLTDYPGKGPPCGDHGIDEKATDGLGQSGL